MDEDGYLEGELLDGRRGLVPSNYMTRLVGEDLMEFHQSAVLGGGAGDSQVADDGWSTSIPQVNSTLSKKSELKNNMNQVEDEQLRTIFPANYR